MIYNNIIKRQHIIENLTILERKILPVADRFEVGFAGYNNCYFILDMKTQKRKKFGKADDMLLFIEGLTYILKD